MKDFNENSSLTHRVQVNTSRSRDGSKPQNGQPNEKIFLMLASVRTKTRMSCNHLAETYERYRVEEQKLHETLYETDLS